MANWTDNLLTVTGPAASLDQLLQDMNGENGLVDFSRHLPTAPVDEDGRELSWWLANADDSAVIDRQPEKVVIYLKSAWEPPVEWADALHRKHPDLCLSLLFAQEEEGFVGLWVADEEGTDENVLTRRVVGYPAVWGFLNEMGHDFGWDEPDEDPAYREEVPAVG
jgi:hypothetical protein